MIKFKINILPSISPDDVVFQVLASSGNFSEEDSRNYVHVSKKDHFKDIFSAVELGVNLLIQDFAKKELDNEGK